MPRATPTPPRLSTMSRALRTLLTVLPLVLTACGSGDPKKEGLDALQDSRWSDAVASLDKAIVDLDPSSPDYMEVAMGRCKALAHVDAKKAQTEFETLVAAGKVKVADFSEVVSHLLSAKQYVPAIELMDKGIKQFPEDPKMIQIRDTVVAQSKQANDPAANAALTGLGYL